MTQEDLGIKACLVEDRGTLRDFVELAVLIDEMGDERALHALDGLDSLITPVGTEIMTMRFAQFAMSGPVDPSAVDVSVRDTLPARCRHPDYVRSRVRECALRVLERTLGRIKTYPHDELRPGRITSGRSRKCCRKWSRRMQSPPDVTAKFGQYVAWLSGEPAPPSSLRDCE